MREDAKADIVLSDAIPYAICFFLMYVPYLLFVPSPMFPIELVYPKAVHAGICLILIVLLGTSAYVGWRLGRGHVGSLSRISVNPTFTTILWGLVIISVLSHGLLLVTSGVAFLRGGFLAARDAFFFQGLGVFLRFYMIALPLLAVVTREKRKLLIWVLALGGLVLLRSIILSERLAIIEFVMTLWVVAKILRISITLRQVVVVLSVIAALFTVVLAIRIVQQRDNRVRADAVALSGSSTITYYADTQNKFYLYASERLKFPFTAYTQPLDAFRHDKMKYYRSFDVYLKGMSGFSRAILPMLTNPGGMTLMISDFGLLGGTVAACLGFMLSGFVLATARGGGFSLIIAPLMLVQITDFPRENFLELPFGAYILIVALPLWLLMSLFTTRELVADRVSRRLEAATPRS